MTDKIEKLTNIFTITSVCMMHIGLLKEEGLFGYIKNLPLSLPVLLFFIYAVKTGIFSREFFESMSSGDEKPPNLYPIYLGFFFIMFSIAAIGTTLSVLGIAFLPK